MKDLCAHVNDENKLMSDRISTLEHEDLRRKTKDREYKKIAGTIVGVIALIATIVGIAKSCGLF
jgi:hypothetical protein